jgi:glucokinase
MSRHLVADIGGTQIRAALFDSETTTPLLIKKTTTIGDNSALDRLCDLMGEIWKNDRTIESIGVAAAGPTDPYQGIVIAAPNIPGWVNVPLREYISQRFDVPVYVGNDANLAALGEWKFGAGKGHHHLIYMTISTGIGGGVISDDRLILGQFGIAAEMGHVTVIPDGPICPCGQLGHLEALSSGTAIAQYVQDGLNNGVKSQLINREPVTAKIIAEAARSGDRLARDAFDRAGKYLGLMIANYLHLFNPSIIILGGGVVQSGELLLRPTRDSIEANVLSPKYLENLTISKSALGDEAGLLGALVLASANLP